jgi:D-lactate dehydrogenase (cytochrome)
MIIKSDQDIIKNYFEDSSNLKGGWAQKVVIPENIGDISLFLREANAKKIPVTISGGGTTTTGSRIPFGGVVLSTEKLNKIIEVSSAKMSATVEAGVLVEELKCAVEREGLFYTSHPTEKTASVGGTIATNASGSRSFRYGPTRKYVKRLKMVLPDGEIFEIVRGQKFLIKKDPRIELPSGRIIRFPTPNYTMPPVKNSAGYFWKDGMDLIDLFIAQEGTLSVIAQIEFEFVKKPRSIASYFVFFKTEEDSWNFSENIKKLQDTGVLSVEYFDHNAVELLRLKNRNIPADAVSAIFFEQEMGLADNDAVVEGWTKMIMAHNGSLDSTWVAMSEKDALTFTQLRYAIPESINDIIRKSGFRKFSTDIAVPADKFREMMNFYVNIFKGNNLRHVIFGHIGEDHLHVNILPISADEIGLAQDISLQFVKKAVSLGGTVSAEHGIGKLKHKYLQEMFGEQGIREMAEIKKAFDPNCILGLDNIFAKEILA